MYGNFVHATNDASHYTKSPSRQLPTEQEKASQRQRDWDELPIPKCPEEQYGIAEEN